MRMGILTLTIGCAFMAGSAKAEIEPLSLYVATDGRDEWSGTSPVPNSSKTDGPFATIARALDAIRQLKERSGGKLDRPVTVFIRGGKYFLEEPLTLTPDDSGTEEFPITFKAYKGERPVISGGKTITGWEEIEVGGRRLWAAEIPDVKEGNWFFRQLWINGERRRRARHPNKGYLSVATVPDSTPQSPWHEGNKRFGFHRGDMIPWPTASDGEVVVMNRWVESRLPIIGIDEEGCVASFSKRSVFKLDPGDFYYVEHVFELLDEPGEWYLDKKKGILYYMPMPGEEISEVEAIAPKLSHLIRIVGDPVSGRYVENVSFQGITFSHTEWYFPEEFRGSWPAPDIGGFSQAAVGVPGAIFGEGVRECVFEGCTFSHIGNYALELSRGSQNNRISGCEFFDLGAGGVKIGEGVIRDDEREQTYGNLINDCHIHDGGLIFHSAVGIWVGQSYNNVISHNHIHDFYYTGISIGWTWGYGRSLAYGNVVDHNHIHHIGVRSDGDGPILSDMGGIYTLGIQPGTRIRFNVFHDIAGYRYGGWGIYFDEGSTDIVAENNVVYRTTHGGFHQHYGKENVVRNNIFAYGRDQQIQRTRPEPHRSFVFEGNVVYWKEGGLFAGNLSDFNFFFDRNIYWKEGGAIDFSGLSLEQWRERGMDLSSAIVDPMFVDPERGDFGLRDGSPVLGTGFVPIRAEDVGPRKDRTGPFQIRVRDREALRRAIAQARPGTIILLEPGEYEGGFFFERIHGRPGEPILIAAADPRNPPVLRGGNEVLHFSDVSYLELYGLVLVGARFNGLNIDDGGSFDTPSHHIVLRGLKVREIGPGGNCDGIKLSGVTDFRIERCSIERWGEEGQGIDMVGCHRGEIEDCMVRFEDDKGFGIQVKGGSSYIRISRCRFEHAGHRAVNIGGCTGLQFFRPPLKAGEEHAEAREILVERSVFIGSNAPIAFVGVDGATVRFNTIYCPKRWAVRILQETRAEGFVPCRRGVFSDNIVVFCSDRWFEGGVNIGPATAPETFLFSRNWWYCIDDPERSRPSLPVSEIDGVIGKDPLLQDPDNGDLSLDPQSPARHVGAGSNGIWPMKGDLQI